MKIIKWLFLIIQNLEHIQYAVGISPVSIKLGIKTRCHAVSFPFRYPAGGFRLVALDVDFVEVSLPRKHWVSFYPIGDYC